MTQTNTTQNKEELRIPEDLSERDAKKYLIMRSNLALLKDETGTHIRNTILNDYYLELRKSSQAHQSGIEEERKRILEILDYESIYFLPGSMVTVEGIDKDGNRYKAEWVTKDGLAERIYPKKD